MSSISMPSLPEPEANRLVAEVELWLAELAPTSPQTEAVPATPPPAPAPRKARKPRGSRRCDGNTRDVVDLAAELAEAQRVHDLLAAGDPRLTVPTPRVLRAQRQAHEALLLRQAGQSPAVLALRDARVRLWTTVLVMTSAVFGLAWSASGVRDSVMTALGIASGEVGAWLAWAVEPALSLTLLATVGVQAYAAMRDRPVDPESAAGTTLRRTEWVTLGLILILNCWPALTGVLERFAVLPLLVHALGPVAAVVGVRTLPALWSILGCLPSPAEVRSSMVARTGPTGPEYSGNAASEQSRTDHPVGRDVAILVDRARSLIAAGVLPERPSAHQVRAALKVGTDTARSVRDALSGGAR